MNMICYLLYDKTMLYEHDFEKKVIICHIITNLLIVSFFIAYIIEVQGNNKYQSDDDIYSLLAIPIFIFHAIQIIVACLMPEYRISVTLIFQIMDRFIDLLFTTIILVCIGKKLPIEYFVLLIAIDSVSFITCIFYISGIPSVI